MASPLELLDSFPPLGLSDLLAWRDTQTPRPEVLYWRTATDLEVDFVIEHGRRLVPIEVKATSRPSLRDIRAVQAFRDDYGSRCPGGVLIHGGSEVQWLSDRILGVPWHGIL